MCEVHGGYPYVIPMALGFLFSFMDVRYARRLAECRAGDEAEKKKRNKNKIK